MIRALGSSALVSPKPSSRTMSWTCGSRSGSMPTIGHRGRQPDGRPAQQVGLALEGGRRDGHALGLLDGLERVATQPGLAERRDAQVRPADEVADGPFDRGLDRDVRGQPGEQDGDAEGDADDRQDGAAGTSAEAAPGDPVHATTARAGRVER